MAAVNDALISHHRGIQIEHLRRAIATWRAASPMPKVIEDFIKDADLCEHEILKLQGKLPELTPRQLHELEKKKNESR